MRAGFSLVLIFVVAAAIAAVVQAEENEKFSKASCSFALNVLKHVATRQNSSNAILSPASISILLSILQQGAKENTLFELENVLGLSAEESKNGFEKLRFLKQEKEVTFKWGSRCYIRPGLEFDEKFIANTRSSFDVGIEELNFISPKDSADKINKWVAGTTQNHITDMVEPSKIGPGTIILLINAMFFKGNWARPFKKSKTSLHKFETNEKTIRILFMSQKEKFYSDRDSSLGAKWIQLPFQNKRFAMVFILPTKKYQLDKLLDKLTGDDLHQIFSHKGVSHVKVRIPKFKLSEKISLVDTLEELGLTDVFSGASNLSGMTSKAEHLEVSEIMHQASVEINEEGGTGSAATVVQLLRTRTPSLSFIANEPFLFFIIDVDTKIPLFAGKVIDPTL